MGIEFEAGGVSQPIAHDLASSRLEGPRPLPASYRRSETEPRPGNRRRGEVEAPMLGLGVSEALSSVHLASALDGPRIMHFGKTHQRQRLPVPGAPETLAPQQHDPRFMVTVTLRSGYLQQACRAPSGFLKETWSSLLVLSRGLLLAQRLPARQVPEVVLQRTPAPASPPLCGSRGVAAIPMVRRCGVPLSSGDGADKGKCLPQGCRIIYRGQGSAISRFIRRYGKGIIGGGFPWRPRWVCREFLRHAIAKEQN
ncbi:hypothetical protein E2C01_028015 [Portunus trituberculatus]|uniref:Uncharacterized protein n=1 Tax=Portunus trituberculatus TaxID=210409 RepID=A0A5B7EMS7_PORTR|nr:hypothetical protein [Portunus trituberculatus]